MHSMEKRKKTGRLRKMVFLSQIGPKLEKTGLKSVFIGEKKYTEPENFRFDLIFLFFHDFTGF